MWAAKTGKDVSVKILADYELGKKDNEGRTASELARESGYKDIADYLEQREKQLK